MAPTQQPWVGLSGGCVGDSSVWGSRVRRERPRPSAQTGNRARKICCSSQCRGQGSSEQSWAGPEPPEGGALRESWSGSCRLTRLPPVGAISSGFRLEESPFVPYDFINSSASPASPPAPVGDGWPRAKSPSGSSSVNWPPGKRRPAASFTAQRVAIEPACVIGLSAQATGVQATAASAACPWCP